MEWRSSLHSLLSFCISLGCLSSDQRGPLPHTHLRAPQLPGSDDGVQWRLRFSAGSFPQPWHLLLQRHGGLLDPLRALQLPRSPVLHEARRVPQVQRLGGHLRHHWVLPQNHRFLIRNLTQFCWFYLHFSFILITSLTSSSKRHVFLEPGNVDKVMFLMVQ